MTANDIRNIALLGHGGSGKTSLVEQMLFMTKGIDRLGKTADGNTTCDYDAEEIKRQISISLAFAPVMYKGKKINVMDAPGNFDFSGEAVCAIRAAECAVIVGNAKDGLSVGMERTWKMLGKKPRMMFIHRVEEANADYASCIEAVKAKYGTAIAPIVATKACLLYTSRRASITALRPSMTPSASASGRGRRRSVSFISFMGMTSFFLNY